MHSTYKLKPEQTFIGAGRVVLTRPRKTCPTCGKTWVRVPAYAVDNGDGLWWNCACKSTLLERIIEPQSSR